MNSSVSRIAMLLILGVSLWGSAQPAKDADAFLTPEVVAKLEKGDVVTIKKGTKDAKGGSVGQGRAVVLVEKPVAEVWDVLNHREKFPEFMPHLVSTEKYREKGNEIGVIETVKVPFMKVRYHAIQVLDPDAHTIVWHLDKTQKNDINETTGSWVLKPHGDAKTIVVYSVNVDSGMYLPKMIEDFFMNKDLPNVVKAVKKRAESGGAWKK